MSGGACIYLLVTLAPHTRFGPALVLLILDKVVKSKSSHHTGKGLDLELHHGNFLQEKKIQGRQAGILASLKFFFSLGIFCC